MRHVKLVFLVIFVHLSINCASSPRNVVIKVRPGTVHLAREAEEVFINEVDIPRMPITEAIKYIFDALRASRAANISYAFEYGKAEKYAQKKTPLQQWRLRSRKVQFRASNIRLTSLLEQICLQAGWSYEVTPDGFFFVDDARHNREARVGNGV